MERGMASNCDPVSGSARMVTGSEFGLAEMVMETVSSPVVTRRM